MQLDADDGGILVAQGSKPTIRQRSPFANEDHGRLNGWADFKVSGKGFSHATQSGHDLCLFPLPCRNMTEPLRSPIIRSWRSKSTRVADPTARKKHDGEDRRRSDVGSQFDFPQAALRTWVRSKPLGAKTVRFNSLTGFAGLAAT